jgi:tetratricopeptide (TPR) repeat protein
MGRITQLALWSSIFFMVCYPANGQQKYKDYRDAMNAGVRLANNGDHAASIEPLEAALHLATDDAQRLRTTQALIPAYRGLPEIDKMLAAQEFIIRHTERRAGRSLAARDVASFLHQRGKLDVGIEKYDSQLKQNPKDPAALTILAIIFTEAKRNDPRGAELKKRLEELDRDLARQLAEQKEKDASTAPQLAASNLKDAATAWLEAGDKDKALAAAKNAAAGPPEQRTQILTYQWRDSLGDVFLKVGEPKLAIEQFEAALAATDQPGLKKSVEKKLAEARAAAGK